jgi:phosphoserine phosphatase
MKYELVTFDLDGVIVEERSSWEWIHRHFGVDNDDALIAFIRGEIDDLEFMRRDIALWKDLKPDVGLDDITRILLKAPVIKGSAEAVSALRNMGVKTAIISGGIDLLADHIGLLCGIDRVIANGLVADEAGRLLGEGILNVELRDKGMALKTLLNEFGTEPSKCVAIGNSWVDVTMFDIAGLGIAFNPIDDRVVRAADVVVQSDDLRDVLPYLK